MQITNDLFHMSNSSRKVTADQDSFCTQLHTVLSTKEGSAQLQREK